MSKSRIAVIAVVGILVVTLRDSIMIAMVVAFMLGSFTESILRRIERAP